MQIKQRIERRLCRFPAVGEFLHNRERRVLLTASASLGLNIGYAVYNGVLGVAGRSVWFLVLCAYYILLSVMRYAAVSCAQKRRRGVKAVSGLFVMRFTGGMLTVLGLVLAVSVYYSIQNEVAVKNGTIVMITIATYTFCKVTLAFVNAAKAAKHRSPLLTALRNIGCADAAASVLSLQRAMLVSFEGMTPSEIRVMNAATGAAVCLYILILGVVMMLGIVGGKENGKIQARQSK